MTAADVEALPVAGDVKFLVDRKGNVVARYAPNDTPEAMAADIEKLL